MNQSERGYPIAEITVPGVARLVLAGGQRFALDDGKMSNGVLARMVAKDH